VSRAIRMLSGLLGALALAGAVVAELPSQRSALPSDRAWRTLLLDAARAGDRLVAVGARGHVVLSDDGGETWRQASSVPTQVLLTGVTFHDARRGWAVGHDAVILHTSDGGESWRLQHADPGLESPLFSVWFGDGERGIATGAFGLMLETRDGGTRWQRTSMGPDTEDLHLNEIFSGRDGTLLIAAESGVVYRSDDLGARWRRIQTPYPGSLWGGLGLPDGALLVFGMRGHLLRSEDGGRTWQELGSGTEQSFGGGARLADGRVVLAGLGGAVAVSEDAGRTFMTTIRASRKGSNAVLGGDDERILVFGEGGVETFGE